MSETKPQKRTSVIPERVVGLVMPTCAACEKPIQTAYNTLGEGRYHRDVPECQATRLERVGQRTPVVATPSGPVQAIAVPLPDPVDAQTFTESVLGADPGTVAPHLADVAAELDRIAAEGVPGPSCPACYIPHVDGPRACYSSDQAQRIRARGESGKRDWDWTPSGPQEVKDSAIQRRRATRTDLEADAEQLMDYPMPWREKPLVDTKGDWRKWAPPPQELGTEAVPPRPWVKYHRPSLGPYSLGNPKVCDHCGRIGDWPQDEPCHGDPKAPTEKLTPLAQAIQLVKWWKPGGPEHDGWVGALIRDLEKISLDRRKG